MYHLVTVTDIALHTCHLYVVPGDNQMQCALDACKEHQKMYGGDEDMLRMNALPLELANKPVQAMQLEP